MKLVFSSRRQAAALSLSLCLSVGCYADQKPSSSVGAGGKNSNGGSPTETSSEGGRELASPSSGGNGKSEGGSLGSAGADEGVTLNPADFCDPITASEPLRARSSTMSNEAVTAARFVATADLFNRFKSFCGGCHSESFRAGAFSDQPVASIGKFIELVGEDALKSMRLSDPAHVMPPPSVGGVPWNERTADDPVVQFANLLEVWLEAGKPAVSFELPAPEGSEQKPYVFPRELGEALTNIGSCVPQASIVGIETERSLALDEKFAAMKGFADLPLQLEETDLYTFDSAPLATHAVVAFAPSYPLWSDDAGKIRHVRVPRGESIHYDEATREFRIPPNTRFYKTFLKKVIDSEGHEGHRKIETRLIVARQDDCSEEPCRVTAIMATYAWDEDETRGARLVTEPLRNGEPFTDQVFTYATDEVRLAALLASGPPKAEDLRSATRHYAIPGSTRCLQCHEGSSSDSGILGFTPIQVNRWPYVEEPDLHAPGTELRGHGVTRETAPIADELTQLQRLIDYGIVTGLDSPDDVVPLKESQAEPPRNGYELLAQGYMLGNCSHCHNPEGYPSRVNPELSPLMNFYPSAEGGIFEFPLERYSPRMRRSDNQSDSNSRIPYITPSLRDYEYEGNADFGAPAGVQRKHYRKPLPGGAGYVQAPVDAPWRSFIYRNTDAPFTYSDDFAIFPHMPMNAPGFDCRAPRIMANWMLSIPAQLKSTPDAENTEAQPYESVTSSNSSHAKQVAAARRRVLTYQQGARFNYCPDTSDIQAAEVLEGDSGQQSPYSKGYDPPGSVPGLSRFSAGIPDRPHWVVTDLTDVPPPWAPRRGDWADFLGSTPDRAQLLEMEAKDPDQRRVLAILDANDLRFEDVRLTDELKLYATRELSFGFWEQRPECADVLSTMPSLLSELETGNPARWSGVTPPEWTAPPQRTNQDQNQLSRSDMSKPVYKSSPGAAIFNQICSNCHGPLGDGDSINANTILNLTGGDTRVANLKDGFLQASNREVFAEEAQKLGIGTDDMAGRYLAWMALGGTQRVIPAVVVNSIGNVKVFGEQRPWLSSNEQKISGNMLESARQLCEAALMMRSGTLIGAPRVHARQGPSLYEPFFRNNGDQGMWQRICAIARKPPIFMITSSDWTEPSAFNVSSRNECNASDDPASICNSTNRTPSFPEIYDAAAYGDAPVITIAPPTYVIAANSTDTDKPARVGSVIKSATSLSSVVEPVAWCLRRPQRTDYMVPDPDTGQLLVETFRELAYLEELGKAEAFASLPANAIGGKPLPFCPEPYTYNRWSYGRVKQWPVRGAMNAGLAVFAYLQKVADGEKPPTLQWDQCNKLPLASQ